MSSCGGGAAAQCTKNPLEEHDEDRRSESLDSSKQLQDAPDEPPTPRYLKPACVLIGAAIVCLALFVSNQDQTQTTNNTPAGHEQISLEMQSHVARLTDSIGDIKTNLTLIQSEVGLGYLREQRLALGYRHVTANATDLQANVDQLADSVGDIKSNLTLLRPSWGVDATANSSSRQRSPIFVARAASCSLTSASPRATASASW